MHPSPPPPPPPPGGHGGHGGDAPGRAPVPSAEWYSRQRAAEEASFEQLGFSPAPAPPAPPPERPLIAAVANSLVLIPLCRKGDRAGIENAIARGATVEEVDVEGNTPLHVAVEAPRNEIATVSCLLEQMADPNVQNRLGAAPLHYVCLRKSNWRGIANLLLENGANIDCQTFAGKSALHFAAEHQLPELVEVLCLFGADPNLLDTKANTAVHLAVGKVGGRDTVKKQILEQLVSASACLQVHNLDGYSPMHMACSTGSLRCVQYLLEARSDLCETSSRGETGLHLACSAGHMEVVQLFMHEAFRLIDAQDIAGNTPLHAAAYEGNLECAMILLRNGAEVELKNEQSLTAYEVSTVKGSDLASRHNPELMQVLKEAQKERGCRQS